MAYLTNEKVIEYLNDEYRTVEEEIYMMEQDLSALKDRLDKIEDSRVAIGLIPEDEQIPEKLIPEELVAESRKEDQEKLDKWIKSVSFGATT